MSMQTRGSMIDNIEMEINFYGDITIIATQRAELEKELEEVINKYAI